MHLSTTGELMAGVIDILGLSTAIVLGHESGKNHVTRHANTFTVLFDVADAEQRERIAKNVIISGSPPASADMGIPL